jgi:uncharacterized protein
VAFVSIVQIELHFPENGDLKGKRKELQSLKAQLQRRFGASVAETAHQELWQRATLLAAVVGEQASFVGERADALERFVASRHPDGSSTTSGLVATADVLGD